MGRDIVSPSVPGSRSGALLATTASRSALRCGPPPDDLVGPPLKHDGLAIDEDSLVMTLTRCLPSGEIPAPDLAAVIVPAKPAESSVPDIAEKGLGNQMVDGLLFPKAGVLAHPTARCAIGDSCGELI